MLIYQVFCGRHPKASTAAHSGQVFHRLAKFEWQRLRRNGIDTVYLLGVWDNRGPILVKDENGIDLGQHPNRLPSPFAVTDHTLPHPNLGSMATWLDLIKAIHDQGMKVWVDFVPNQTGTAHSWVTEHPDYYQHREEHLVTAFSQDVYLLNYQVKAVREAMTGVLLKIAGMEIDGVRCDMAHLTPIDFWREAITAVKLRYPDFKFIAEAYSQTVFDWKPLTDLLDAGFDGIYHEFFYRNLKAVYVDHQHMDYVVNHLRYLLDKKWKPALVTYLANHDDPLLPGVKGHQPAWIQLLITLNYPVLIYNGQLNGLERRLAHHYADDLPPDTCEFNAMPGWFKNAAIVQQSLKPHITDIRWLPEGIIQADAEISGTAARLYTNLSTTPYPLPEGHGGLLHHYEAGKTLLPGETELMFR